MVTPCHKIILDRTTCMENLYHLQKPGLTEGKIVGILVNGHEHGAIKTAMDIWLNFEQLGYIMAPVRHRVPDARGAVQQQNGP